MTVSTIGIILSVASFGRDVYDLVKKDDHLKEINKAYQDALKKWCKNSDIRRRIADQFKNFSDLALHIQENENLAIDNEYASFLVVWESELRNNPLTFGYLNEILSRQSVSIGKDLLSGQEAIADKIDDIGEQVGDLEENMQKCFNRLEQLYYQHSIPPQFTPPLYQKIDDYIGRKVRDYNNVDHLKLYLNRQSYQPKHLIDYLIQDIPSKRLVLYSEAQAGKTIEMLNLAHEAQSSELFNVYLFDLKHYAGSELSNYVHLDYLTSGISKRSLLILDGLDEVNDEHRPDAISQIEWFASKYPDLSIVVSCRGNFESTNEVSGFKKLYLNTLDFNDVKVYIQHYCTNSEQLVETIEQKGLYNLVYNPFYLRTITKYYLEKGTLPETKPEIYDYVIAKSLQIDQRRGRGSAVPIKDIAMPLLEKIAFCMEFTEHLSFTYKELTQGLSLSVQEVDACTKYTIFKMDTEGNYSFMHNAFKEYLTAKHLSGISFDNLKAAICYPETDILRPNLYNTVLLLVSILKEDDPLVSQLIGWFAEHEPEILFMCEHNFLSENRSVEIFKGYLERLKRYGEYISYQMWKKTMAFANTQNAILYLFEEAKKEKKLSSHLSNVITLLQFADLTQLSENKQDELYEFGLELINQCKINRDKQHVAFHIPENNLFRTSARIAQLHSVIKDCDNPLLLNEFFRLVQEAELSDDYIDWIISKKECIRDYHTDGTTHIVRKEPMIDVLTSVKRIDNIIKALGQFDFVSGVHFDGEKRSEIISRVFVNLHKVPQAAITGENINDILALLGSERLTNFFPSDTSSETVKGYRDFLFEKGYDESVFTQYYAELKVEIISSKLNDADGKDYFWRCLNVLSTLMTDERFDYIMNDSDLSEEQRFWFIVNPLGNYQVIWSKGEWNSKIESLKKKYRPQVINHMKNAQNGFDVLFDYEKFLAEIQLVRERYEVLPSGWEWCAKLRTEDNIDESVTNFIWQNGERDDRKEIAMLEVLKKANDPAIFNEFIFIQLDNYLRQKVSASAEQQSRISALVSDWVDNIDGCKDIHRLGRLIDAYNAKLNDEQLLSLLPYSYVAIKTSTPPALFDDSIDSSLLRHIHDKISDRKLIVAEIDRILDENKHLSPPLFIKVTDYIVHNRLTALYKNFEKILFGEVDKRWRGGTYSDYSLNIAEKILKLGTKGLKILDSFKGRFNSQERLYYYQMILSDDTLKLDNTTEIITDIHDIHDNATSKDERELTLSLLSKLGDAEGLRMIVNYYRDFPDCFCYNRPVLIKYGAEHLDSIKQIFEIDSTLDQRERSQMREIAFNWLNTFAMQSVENRDVIIAYYTQLSETDLAKYFHLLRVSKYLYNKYFEDNSPAMSITDSVQLFASI